MLKSFKHFIIAVCLIFTMTNSCFADNAGQKLLRGIGNICTGWLEIPVNVYKTSIANNPILGMTIGLVKGIGMTIARTCAGAYEIITFPFPIPEDYEAILEPEYVFQKEI